MFHYVFLLSDSGSVEVGMPKGSALWQHVDVS